MKDVNIGGWIEAILFVLFIGPVPVGTIWLIKGGGGEVFTAIAGGVVGVLATVLLGAMAVALIVTILSGKVWPGWMDDHNDPSLRP